MSDRPSKHRLAVRDLCASGRVDPQFDDVVELLERTAAESHAEGFAEANALDRALMDIAGKNPLPPDWTAEPPEREMWCWVKMRGAEVQQPGWFVPQRGDSRGYVAIIGSTNPFSLDSVELYGPRLLPPPLPEEVG